MLHATEERLVNKILQKIELLLLPRGIGILKMLNIGGGGEVTSQGGSILPWPSLVELKLYIKQYKAKLYYRPPFTNIGGEVRPVVTTPMKPK